MFSIEKDEDAEKNYILMVETVKHMVDGESDVIANLANISSVINAYMDNLNWAGFYILKGEELVLGPFQGMPACVRIKLGKGVCGTAASEKRIILVDDVEKFPGHIACDSASKSELVAPIYKDGEVYGVLDLDSPIVSRFTEVEKKYISQISDIIGRIL